MSSSDLNIFETLCTRGFIFNRQFIDSLLKAGINSFILLNPKKFNLFKLQIDMKLIFHR